MRAAVLQRELSRQQLVCRSGFAGIEVELRRGGITVKLSWPMSAALDLSAWMRELLR